MPLRPDNSFLLMVDFQARLMPAIERADDVIAKAQCLLAAAALLGVPGLFTEQNPSGLGPTIEALTATRDDPVVSKMSFDACGAPGILERIPSAANVVVAGCEAHVCVLQTVTGLLDAGRKVAVIRDAVGARSPEDKEAALARMLAKGADILTCEMLLFEWLGTAAHPRFREVLKLIKS